MKETRSQTVQIAVRILYISILLIHFLMLAFDVNAQTTGPGFRVQPADVAHSMNPKIDRVRNVYTAQIGVREKQPNSGLEVEKYLRYVNLPKGNPWCAAFVCWVYGEAGVENPRTGWSPGLFGGSGVIWESGEPRAKNQESRFPPSVPYAYPTSLVRARRLWSPKLSEGDSFSEGGTGNSQLATPATGDVFGLYFPEKGRIAHVGFVDEWKDPWVTTVEGNTNVVGGREGDGVYRKRRLTRSVYRVARYIE